MNFGGQAVLVNGHRVSAEVVALLGLNGPLHPEAGRAFIPSEFAPDSEPVVAISHRLWQTQYASADSIVGQTITADGKPLRVVAVLSREFDFFPDSDLLVPLTFAEPGSYIEYARRLEVYGSLRPGLTPDLAALMLASATRYFSPAQVASVESVRERVFRGFRPTVKVLSVVSLIILVVGCLNFATLLTVRSSDRQPELAVRIALGAGRQRIVRQLVTEALVLSFAGGVAGVLLAYLGRGVLAGNTVEGMLALPRNLEWRVIAFATLLAVTTGVLFSLGPARRATARVDLESALRDAVSSRLHGIALGGLRANWLVGSIQVAFTMVLLVGAALLVKSLLRIQAFDPGYDSIHAVTLRFELPRSRYRTDADVARFVELLTERIRGVPGVDDVGAASSLPFFVGALGMRMFLLEGPIHVSGPPEAMPLGWRVPPPPPPPPGMIDMPPLDFFSALSCEVDPAFFRTMRIPLVKGRDFSPFDTAASPPVVIINQAMAARYWPDTDPVGRRMRLGPLFPWKTIVGVVGNIRRFARDDEIRSEYYEPFAQAGDQRRLFARLGTDVATRALFGAAYGESSDGGGAQPPQRTRHRERSRSVGPYDRPGTAHCAGLEFAGGIGQCDRRSSFYIESYCRVRGAGAAACGGGSLRRHVTRGPTARTRAEYPRRTRCAKCSPDLASYARRSSRGGRRRVLRWSSVDCADAATPRVPVRGQSVGLEHVVVGRSATGSCGDMRIVFSGAPGRASRSVDGVEIDLSARGRLSRITGRPPLGSNS